MTQLVGMLCAKCRQTIPSIVKGEFCAACNQPVHKACKLMTAASENHCPECGCVTPDSAVLAKKAASAPAPIRFNKLGFRLLLGGGCCFLIGAWWLVDYLLEGTFSGILDGLYWKGPLLMAAGAGSFFYGYRLMKAPVPVEKAKSEANGNAST